VQLTAAAERRCSFRSDVLRMTYVFAKWRQPPRGILRPCRRQSGRRRSRREDRAAI